MKIIYPPLVEQAYVFAKAQGLDVTKEDMYKMQVKEGFLSETGEPTQLAIDEGLVTAFQQKHETLKQFKKEYPIFHRYPSKEFTQQAGVWYVSQKVLDETVDKLEQDLFGYDEKQQLKVYMSYRDYEDPYGSIPVMKGVFHPWYTPYDDSQFHVVDGLVAVPESIVADMARRAECGELDLDAEKLYEMAEQLRRR